MRPSTPSETEFDATVYDSARKPYPQKVIDYCARQISVIERPILDLGCGTGIATRQLSELGCEVIGCDPDPKSLSL